MKISKIAILLSFFMLFGFNVDAQKQKKNKNVKQADQYYSKGLMNSAVEFYKLAYPELKEVEDKAYVTFQLGECYMQLGNPKQAEVFYNKAVVAKYYQKHPIVHYRLGESLQQQEKYPEAISAFNDYLALQPGDAKAKKQIKACELAQEWKDDPTKYEVNNEILLNSKEDDYAPVFADKKNMSVYLVSNREGSTGSDVDNISGLSFADIYSVDRDKKGKWGTPVPLKEGINTAMNEGALGMDKKKSTMYYTHCPTDKKKDLGCQIWKVSQTGTDWGEPEQVLQCKSADSASVSVHHPALSPDGNMLVYSSDMVAPGQGEAERTNNLWYIKYEKKSKTWSEPQLFPGQINSKGNELFPMFRDNGDLYFASNGHQGMGGLDLFVSEKVEGKEQWQAPVNLKYPLNSPNHDLGILFDEKAEVERGLISSDREGGKGGMDIYNFKLPPVVFALQVLVKEFETHLPLAEVKVELKGSDNTFHEVVTDENGYFNFEIDENQERYVKPNTTYEFKVSKEDGDQRYFAVSEQFTTVDETEAKTFIKEIYLTMIKATAIKMPEVRYELGKAELMIIQDSIDSRDSLDYLYDILVDNPTLVVQLEAHTDTRGDAGRNQVLSDRRAKTCVDYLITKGIDPERLKSKGLGETNPKISDKEIAAMKTREEKEAAHGVNRRTEFRVLNFDYVPKPKVPENTEGGPNSPGEREEEDTFEVAPEEESAE